MLEEGRNARPRGSARGQHGLHDHHDALARDVPPSRQPPASHEGQFLEVHTPTGNLYVLGDWRLAVDAQVVHGSGLLYDARRVLRSRGTFEIPWSEVALFEATGAEALEVESVSPFATFFVVVLAGLGTVVALFVIAFALNPPGG